MRARATVLLLVCVGAVQADRVRFRHLSGELDVVGNVLAVDGAGTLVLEARDGQRHVIPKADRIEWDERGRSVPKYTKAQLHAALRKEFGPNFHLHDTRHYLIVYDCEPQYAEEAGALFEKTFKVFQNFFANKGGFRFRRPELPLIAVVHKDRAGYVRHLAPLVGPVAASSAGLYLPLTNRMYMFDAFGQREAADGAAPAASPQPAAARPGAARPAVRPMQFSRPDNRRVPEDGQAAYRQRFKQNVTVLIHEAVHQIAFNTGFHTRLADNPVWLVEGMAMFFETPDLSSRNLFAGVGSVNPDRLQWFAKDYDRRVRSPGRLRGLVVADRFSGNSPDTYKDYAEAWALTHYLAKAHTRGYMRYVETVNAREPLRTYPAEQRIADFTAAFGQSPDEIEMDFLRYMAALVEKSR